MLTVETERRAFRPKEWQYWRAGVNELGLRMDRF
jgi:hypothetical protein